MICYTVLSFRQNTNDWFNCNLLKYIYVYIYSVYTTYNTHSVSSIRLRFTMPADPPNYTQSFDTTLAVEHLIRSF